MKNKISSILKKLLSTGFAHVFIANSFGKVLAFASGIILVRILSKDDYGVYAYAYNIFTFCVLASGFGLNSGILQLGSELGESDEEKKIYGYGVKKGLLINLLLAVIILGVSLLIPLPIAGSNALLLVMSFMLIPMLATDFQTTRLRTLLKTKFYSYASISSAFLILLGSVVGAFLSGSKGLIAGRYIAYLSLSLLLAFFLKSPLMIKKAEEPLRENTRSLWRISLISMVNNGLSALLTLLEIFLLGLLIRNESIVASYKVATNIPFALDFIPQAFVIYIYPYFARHREDRTWVRKNFYKALLAIGTITAIIAAALIMFAPWVIEFCFGAEYLDSIESFKILIIAFAIGGTFRVVSGNVLVTQRRLKFNFVVAVIGTLINLVANLILIPLIGAYGAAIAHLLIVSVTGLINTCGVFWYTRKSIKPTNI